MNIATTDCHYSALTIRQSCTVVLETVVLVSRPLETDFMRSWSWSWHCWSWPWSRSVGLELFFKTTHVSAEPISALPNASVKAILSNDQFKCLQRFVNRMYCVPATSVLVERIFSHGGIFMRTHRARMSDCVIWLCNLVFAKCNAHL